MDVLRLLSEKLHPVLLSPGSHFSFYSLAFSFCVAITYLAYRQHRRRGRMRPAVLARAFFSPALILHRSTRADLFYFFVNVFVTGLFIGWACQTVAEISQFTQTSLTDRFGLRTAVDWPPFAVRGVVTLVAFLAYEFGYWFDHYLKHRIPFLWETHKTHHTAERLTPWTVWRVHPLELVDVHQCRGDLRRARRRGGGLRLGRALSGLRRRWRECVPRVLLLCLCASPAFAGVDSLHRNAGQSC